MLELRSNPTSVCVCVELTDRRRHLPPLQHRILGDASVGVDVDAFVFVTDQNLRSSAVWQNDDGVRMNGAVDLKPGESCESGEELCIRTRSV